MNYMNRFMQDVDLLFSNVDLLTDRYFFQPMRECKVNYPVFDQRFNDDEQQIIIAAPGALKEDFEISLKEDILSIIRTNDASIDTENKFITDNNGEAVENENYKKYTYAQHRISRKKFDIAFKIPKKWDAENLSVKLEKGELIITIPVKEEEKPKVKDFSIE